MKKILLFLSLVCLPFSMITNVKAASYASDTLKGKVVTSGDGLYVDKYNEGRYVYKGGNTNNFIKFNDELWRIISVEKDGTLKIIRVNHLGESMLFNTNDDINEDGTYCAMLYKEGSGCNAWAKTDYINDGYYSKDGVDFLVEGSVMKDSSLNTYLNNDWFNSLSSEAKKVVSSYDYHFGPVTYSKFHNIIWNWNPDLSLKTILSDENTQSWNGNIALPTVSDIFMASSDDEKCGVQTMFNNMYPEESYQYPQETKPIELYNRCENVNWLIPSKKYSFTDYSYLLLNGRKNIQDDLYGIELYGDSGIGSIYAMNYHGIAEISAKFSEYNNNYLVNWYNTQSYVRPVTHLRSDMEIIKGNGSENNPYELQCDECSGTKNNDSNESNLIVGVPPTSMFISAFIIGGFILITIICIIIYLKVFKKNIK